MTIELTSFLMAARLQIEPLNLMAIFDYLAYTLHYFEIY